MVQHLGVEPDRFQGMCLGVERTSGLDELVALLGDLIAFGRELIGLALCIGELLAQRLIARGNALQIGVE